MRRIAGGIAVVALVGCSRVTPVALPSPDAIASIDVTRRSGTEVVPLAKVDDPVAIQAALSVLATLNVGWRRPRAASDAPEYTAALRAPAGTVLVTVWVGDSWLSVGTLDELPKTKRVRSLTSQERTDLLRALAVLLLATPPNNAVNPPHSVVTALAQDGKRRAAGRAGYRER